MSQDLRFHSSIENFFRDGYESFKACIRFYGLFHISFISFLSLQLLAFLLFFSYFSKSLTAACGLALFFLTLFSYFVLLFFFQAKKPQQLIVIKNRFIEAYHSLLPDERETTDALLSLSHSLEEFASFLEKEEPFFYSSSLNVKALIPLACKFKIWLHWKNFHQMKEILLLQSIDVLISLVKRLPTDVEVHASLAGAYSKISKLYVHPKKREFYSLLWISPEYLSPAMKELFDLYSNKAIEEFKILEELSPADPWVMAHLAEIYRLQENAQEEIIQCERLLSLTPENADLLFKLGVLYFREGRSAKGLKMYEQLLQGSSDKAQRLIQHYN